MRQSKNKKSAVIPTNVGIQQAKKNGAKRRSIQSAEGASSVRIGRKAYRQPTQK
jgi:hypothetical protein